ncbi:hypothetical protein PVK06_040010 [Gossypium arboreum]|uniref:Uncharacterized protein n=1 Tax=Gossypium arboreum TaxID=29729 RepID=A0ABR0N4D7_GOSAR|nr:hypothetical protein PVK06_040010 [Gossypium arboreum]
MTFYSRYLEDVETRMNRPSRNAGLSDHNLAETYLFQSYGEPTSKVEIAELDDRSWVWSGKDINDEVKWLPQEKMPRRRLRDLSIVQNTPNSEETNSEQQTAIGSSNVLETPDEPAEIQRTLVWSKVGRLQLFDITYRKKDGSPMTSKVGEIMDKLKVKKAEYEAIASSDSSVNLEDIDNKIITKVLGHERYGRVQLQRCSVNPTQYFGSSSQQYMPSGSQAHAEVQRVLEKQIDIEEKENEEEKEEEEEEKRGEEEEEVSEDEGTKKVKGSSRKGSSRKSGRDSAEKKEPVTPCSDRPTRERKVVENVCFLFWG